MKRTTAVLLCSVMVLALVGTGAPAAQARPVVSLHFTCTMHIASWPTDSGGSATCDGEVTGIAVLDGRPIPCVPHCSFVAAVINYSEECEVSGGPPAYGIYEGYIYVQGVFVGTFDWLRVGTNFYFVPDGTTEGHGVWIPLPPTGACGAPLPLTVNLRGQMEAV